MVEIKFQHIPLTYNPCHEDNAREMTEYPTARMLTSWRGPARYRI